MRRIEIGNSVFPYFGYIAVLITIAALVPATPDELNRILAVTSNEIFHSAWAPLNFVPVIFAQALATDQSQIILLSRIFNLFLLLVLFHNMDLNYKSYEMVLTLPCAAVCILSTPQLIILILFYLIISKRLVILGLILAPLGSGIIAPIYFIFSSIKYLHSRFFSALLGEAQIKRMFLEILIYIGSALSLNKLFVDKYSLFFETQSALNNFKLGNNSAQFSPFGNAASSAKLESPVDVLGYFYENFLTFAGQWASKILIYFSPFDSLKGFELGLLFNIVVASAWAILVYSVFNFLSNSKLYRQSKSVDYFMLLVASGVIYSLFTVKYRYRAPFELLFYISLIFSSSNSKR